MAFFPTHRFSASSLRRGLTNILSAGRTLTPQERADLYVSRMPIAVITSSLGGHP